jgi:hypothetical protein
MEVHDTHSHEPVFCSCRIPTKEARCLEEVSTLQMWETMPRSFAVWPTTSLLLLAASQFASPVREDDKFWDRFFDSVLGSYGRPHQSLLDLHDFQTAYGMDPGGVQRGPGRGIPRDGQGRGSMYEGPEWGAFGKSRRRHACHKATAWEYWIPGTHNYVERFLKICFIITAYPYQKTL